MDEFRELPAREAKAIRDFKYLQEEIREAKSKLDTAPVKGRR